MSADQLIIPEKRVEVTGIGELQTARSHQHIAHLRQDDYIGLSSGTTRKTDKGKVYVVRADGSVFENAFSVSGRNCRPAMYPCDTVVVPLDAERIPKLRLWQSVAQIINNLTVAFAAIKIF